MPAITDRPMTNQPYAYSLTHPGLPFNGLHPRNPCNYMDYYLFTDPKGMEG